MKLIPYRLHLTCLQCYFNGTSISCPFSAGFTWLEPHSVCPLVLTPAIYNRTIRRLGAITLLQASHEPLTVQVTTPSSSACISTKRLPSATISQMVLALVALNGRCR